MGEIFITSGNFMDEIERIIKHATENPTSLETMEALTKGEASPGGVNEDFTIYVVINDEQVCITYTHEQQPPCMCKHLSVSVHEKGQLPSDKVMQLIMTLVGFKTPYRIIIQTPLKWNEEFGGTTHEAINLIEPLSGKISDLLKK